MPDKTTIETTGVREVKLITTGYKKQHITIKLAIHLSFFAFRHVRALFREIVNQSLYTSHNIADFIHLWFCEKLDEKLSLSPLRHFVKITTVWRERRNARWEKWLARWFTKCHLYTYRFSHFTNIFSHSRQFDDKCMAGFMLVITADGFKLPPFIILKRKIFPKKRNISKRWCSSYPCEQLDVFQTHDRFDRYGLQEETWKLPFTIWSVGVQRL